MNFYFSLLIAFIFSLFPLISLIKKKKVAYYLPCFLILLIGCFLRLFLIDKYPVGLNQDEASIGYEAYSILQNGVDRNGFSYPVNFVSWGSGQNVLYAYLSVPFIKLLGLNILSTRIVMALIGCLTLTVVYLFTKSRWALESNLFPDLLLYASMLLYLGVKYHKKRHYFFSSLILGISTYAYGTSYLFVPLFFFLTYGYLLKKREVKLRDALINIGIIIFISFPLILYVIINFFNLDTLKLGKITIPKLPSNRMAKITIASGNQNIFSNLAGFLYMLLGYSNGISYSHMPYATIYYYLSLPLMIYGIVKAFKGSNLLLKILNIYTIACLPIIIFLAPTDVHINIIFWPLLFYACYGMIMLGSKVPVLKILPVFYVIFCTFFLTWYFTDYQHKLSNIAVSLKEALEYVNPDAYDKVYITDTINQPYIYYLFYHKVDSVYYQKHHDTSNDKMMFQDVTRVGNVYFSLPKEEEKKTLIITKKSDQLTYSCEYRKLKDYIVVNIVN